MGQQRICVIGAGPSGITAAKNLFEAGFDDVVVMDRQARVGGNWVFDGETGHSSVFETTHIISSKKYSEYLDFPMPDRYPDYPSHRHLAEYFQAYADHFGVTERVRFGTTVLRCELLDDGGWEIRSETGGDEVVERFDRLVVANGHHWDPRWPDIPGDFAGELAHSHDYKRAAPYAGKRVLVIGGGNSACDVAVETSRVSARTDLSWRRGYWIVPKFVFGYPADHLHHRTNRLLGFLPIRWRLRAMEILLRLVVGPNRLYGLPEPDHHFGETHPTVNTELLYRLRHGAIGPRTDVERFEGETVHFRDGTQADYDTVIACTGFRISHPFLDPSLVDYSDGPVPLYLKMIHPTLDTIAFVGLFQPFGCVWPCADLQSRLLARWWCDAWRPPVERPRAIRNELARPDVSQIGSPRHTITVDEPTFRARLLRELKGSLAPKSSSSYAAPLQSAVRS